MINFERLEQERDQLRERYLNAKPFPHIAIDDFCETEKIEKLYNDIPDIQTKSADYLFGKNKFEKSSYAELGEEFAELHDDLLSERFQKLVQHITNEDIFIDNTFYGGGIHQGKQGSFLDMHADFNYHPLQENWFRNLNLLLYLNKDWKEEYGGHLRLKHKDTNDPEVKVGVKFNRMAIMLCRGYTLHGYSTINFPEGQNRTSIASYAYTKVDRQTEAARTTEWHIEEKGSLKYWVSKIWVPAVKIKSLFSKSKTAKNQ